MEYTMGHSQVEVDPEEIAADPVRNAKKLTMLVAATEHTYEQYFAEDDVRNLAYYRGKFWRGDGHGYKVTRYKAYRAAKNETFPVVDTLMSALAQDLPQVEAIDVRAASQVEVTRENDPMIQGRRVAAVLNWMAEMDDLDETVREWVLYALLFKKSVMKITWSPSSGRVQWRVRLPWEVHFDPAARSVREAGWAFERITLHWSDFKQRLRSGVYETMEGSKPIRPDAYPRSIISQYKDDIDEAYEQRLRKSGLREYVSIVEFWDFRRGVVHHLHPDSAQILMTARIPYGRPYEVLVFHNGVGRIDGIPDVDLIADLQRDINELFSGRGEIVRRLVRRMLVDKRLFPDERAWQKFVSSKSWQPVLVEPPAGKSLQEHIAVTPAMDTTYDFNKHLADDQDAIQRTIGEGDYQRGVHRNVRTAAEFSGIRAGVEGRQRIRSMKVQKGVSNSFKRARDVLKWALQHQQASGIDVEHLAFETQLDTDGTQLTEDLLSATTRFRLLPFSPLMEDRYTRRDSLTLALPNLLNPEEVAKVVDIRELLREYFELYGFRPSILKPKEQVDQEAAAEQQALMAEQAAQAGPDPSMAGGVPGPVGWQPGGPLEAGPPPPGFENVMPFAPVR